jgi:hypothetical protein
VAGFSAFWPQLLPATPESRHPWPTRQAVALRANVGQTWRNGGQPSARSQYPQLLRPVREREAQPLEVRVARPDLSFDIRDLLAAAFQLPFRHRSWLHLRQAPNAFCELDNALQLNLLDIRLAVPKFQVDQAADGLLDAAS